LEERQQHSPNDAIETDPQLLAWALCLEKEKKHVHQWRMAKAVAKNCESPHERPTVRVQLGAGDIHLSKKSSLEWGER